MCMRPIGHGSRADRGIDRRIFLQRGVFSGAVLGCLDRIARPARCADEPRLSPIEEAERELDRAQLRVQASKRSPLVTMRSEQFQAVGDASESFIKLTLDDCELIAEDYFAYYQKQGFDVKRPGRLPDPRCFPRRASLPRFRTKIW